MSKAKTILVLFGGGGKEHKVSAKSAEYIFQKLKALKLYNLIKIELKIENGKFFYRNDQGHEMAIMPDAFLHNLHDKTKEKIDFCFPIIHGDVGETGEIQSYLKLSNISYFGASPEASILCFNKISTKLWLENSNIQTVPFLTISSKDEFQTERVNDFLKTHKEVFVKASKQGSSVGCFNVTDEHEIVNKINEAFAYSSYVQVEKAITGRELEVAVYEYNGEVIASPPGEILTPESNFYDYEQKYSEKSETKINILAKGLSENLTKKIQDIALRAFNVFQLNHMARVDFFIDQEQNIYINEINTMPGHTEISLFPQMVEKAGIKYEQYLTKIIESDHGTKSN